MVPRKSVPQLPRCCGTHRLPVIDALGELLAHDSYHQVASMLATGWPAAAAVDAYKRWLLGRLAEAIDAGALLAEAKAAAS